DDARHWRRAGHEPHGRAEQKDSVDLPDNADGHVGHRRISAVCGLLQQGLDSAERFPERIWRPPSWIHFVWIRTRYRAADFLLHVPAHLPDLPWEATVRRTSSTRPRITKEYAHAAGDSRLAFVGGWLVHCASVPP